jgi:hypothetical protein
MLFYQPRIRQLQIHFICASWLVRRYRTLYVGPDLPVCDAQRILRFYKRSPALRFLKIAGVLVCFDHIATPRMI